MPFLTPHSFECVSGSRGSGIPERVKQQVQETMPHYGHVGVIQAARELSMELDNLAEDEDDVMAITDCPPNKSLEGFPLSPLLKLDQSLFCGAVQSMYLWHNGRILRGSRLATQP